MAWDGTEKAIMRSKIVQKMKGEKASKVAFFMPAASCVDIIEALKTGRINKSTFIVGAEKDTTIKKKIDKKLTALGIRKFHIHDGKLHTFPLHKVLGSQKIDFAFFDFCGDIMPKEMLWFSQTSKCFAVGSRIGFTFSARKRAGKLFYEFYLDYLEGKITEHVYQALVSCDNNWIYDMQVFDVEKARSNQRDSFFGIDLQAKVANQMRAVNVANLIKVQHDVIDFAWFAFKLQFIESQKYQDGDPMVFLHLRLAGHATKSAIVSGKDEMSNMIEQYKDNFASAVVYDIYDPPKRGRKTGQTAKKSGKRNPVMVAAGKKAWASRIRNGTT